MIIPFVCVRNKRSLKSTARLAPLSPWFSATWGKENNFKAIGRILSLLSPFSVYVYLIELTVRRKVNQWLLFSLTAHVKCIQYSFEPVTRWASKWISKGSVQIFSTVKTHTGILVTGCLFWFKHKVYCPSRFMSFLQRAMHSYSFFPRTYYYVSFTHHNLYFPFCGIPISILIQINKKEIP